MTTARALTHWLQHRRDSWQRMERLLERAEGARTSDTAEPMELLRSYRSLARDVSLARSVLPDSRSTATLQALFTRAHDVIYRRPPAFWRDLRDLFVDEVPHVVKDLRGTIKATVALFLVGAAVGWLLVASFPELASLFASEPMIEKVRQGELWTDDLMNVVPSSLLSIGIMTNNITVALFAFALGALYGLGTLYIIGMNGLMLGGIFAFTHEHGLAERLLAFVFAHGVVELSVICLAGAAGVRLGEALIRPGNRERGAAFQHAVAQAGKLLPLCALFLVGAGLIEGYVSPDDSYPMLLRVIIGVCYGVIFWAALTGDLWKFLTRLSTGLRGRAVKLASRSG